MERIHPFHTMCSTGIKGFSLSESCHRKVTDEVIDEVIA